MILLRQTDLPFDLEVSSGCRRFSVWLPASDANGVIARGDDRMTVLRHHAQISILQLEMHLLACAGVKMNCAGIHAVQPAARPAQEGTSGIAERPRHPLTCRCS